MFTTILVLLTVRYYLVAQDELKAAGSLLRDTIVSDFQNAAGATYAAGVRTRELYETVAPQVVSAYEGLLARFGR